MPRTKNPNYTQGVGSRSTGRKRVASKNVESVEPQQLFPHQGIRYPQAYIDRKILAGKILDFDFCTVENFPIVGWLNDLGLEPLFMINLPYYPDLIKEFYASFCFSTSVSLSTSVNGIPMMMTYAFFSSLLNIPCNGTKARSNRNWVEENGFSSEECVHLLFGENAQLVDKMYSRNLRLDYRFLHRAVATHIIPKYGGFDEVTHMGAFTMFHIITGRRINVPLLIFIHMKAIHALENAILAYGNIITKILIHFGLNLNDEVHHALQSGDKLGKGTLGRMGFKKHKRLGTWIPRDEDSDRIDEENEGDEEGKEAQGQEGMDPAVESSPVHVFATSQFEQLMQAINGIESNQRNMETELKSIKRKQIRLERKLFEQGLIGNEGITSSSSPEDEVEDQNTDIEDLRDHDDDQMDD
ncbi:hypothetical protein CFOL_v3_24691 [Cephalotus follicularis]|uniref:Putative plant transposon protein domain-containing protein n=1 Tax=Cephalotus follicularis TaxID=3775 RepID=A0A1Q3CMA7_CEPFO|nr:hypothetical protein CFOL_v3_24691 [Cephalotus follicularis]